MLEVQNCLLADINLKTFLAILRFDFGLIFSKSDKVAHLALQGHIGHQSVAGFGIQARHVAGIGVAVGLDAWRRLLIRDSAPVVLRWLPVGALLLLGFLWQGWLMWAVLVFIFSRHEVEPLDTYTPLGRREMVIAAVLLALFVLTFTPIPLRTVF